MRSKNEAVFGEIIEFVNKYFEKNGRSPSTREIEGAIGKSHVTVKDISLLCESAEKLNTTVTEVS